MDIESVDQAHDSERAAEHSQANMGDQDTLTAGEGEEGAAAARVGEQEGRSDQDHPASKRTKDDEERVEGDDISQEEIQRRVDLPLDVWMMIGEYLGPIDLLQITRVNKLLRQVFTSGRNSKRVWKLAFKNISFPQLKATDWDLINLASLLYEAPRCIACGKTGGIIVDFACRLTRHNTCIPQVYSTAREIRGQVEDLHPETLSCVPSTQFSAGRRVEDHFVTSMVTPMNEYLHYLDSTIFSSRQRDAKKVARQARDDFLLEKKQNLDARSDRRLESQKREQAEQLLRARRKAEEDRRRIENAAIVSRISARFEGVRRRLSALGYESVDINGIANHALVRKQDALTDAGSYFASVAQRFELTPGRILLEWDTISMSVLAGLEEVKRRRLAAAQAQAERSRTETLRPFYQDMLARVSGFERAAFPSFDVFLNLPTVSPFRTGTNQLTTATWSSALTMIQTEITATHRLLKLAYSRRLVKALVSTGHPPSQAFLNALSPPGSSSAAHTRTGEASLTALDLNDPSTLTEQSLDDFLGRFTSRTFWYSDGKRTRGGYGHKMAGFPAIHAFTIPSSSERCARAGPRPSEPWIKILFALLKLTGIEDGAVAEVDEKFEALGASFECRWVSCPSKHLSQRLTFSELLVHVQQREHARFFNNHWREGRIGLEDIVYVPSSVKNDASVAQ
ncbi:hypothetical protein JCM5353_003756 [Sporobolomyces roseus]